MAKKDLHLLSIVSNNLYNEEYKRISVLAMSSKTDNIRHFEINLGKIITNDPKNRESKVMCDQIRSIDKRKLKEKGGILTKKQLLEIEVMLKKFLALENYEEK
jgi:mRNA-degrading endonuclease toxin of MazEF toxin-antitoxin module